MWEVSRKSDGSCGGRKVWVKRANRGVPGLRTCVCVGMVKGSWDTRVSHGGWRQQE